MFGQSFHALAALSSSFLFSRSEMPAQKGGFALSLSPESRLVRGRAIRSVATMAINRNGLLSALLVVQCRSYSKGATNRQAAELESWRPALKLSQEEEEEDEKSL